MGVGRYGIRGSSLSGFRLSCYVAVGLEVLEWYFNDQLSMLDLLGGVGIELVKAGIASAVGYAVGAALATGFGLVALPVIAGAVTVFVVSLGLNMLDKQFGIKTRVRDSLNYAVDNVSMLTDKFQRLDEFDIQIHAENVLGKLVESAIDEAIHDAKGWLLRRLPPGLLPRAPFRFPNFNDF